MNSICKWMAVLIFLICFLKIPVNATPIYSTPKVLVTDYTIEDGAITPGKTNQLTLTLKNMDSVSGVYGVLVTIDSLSDAVYAEYGETNQVYVDNIQPKKEAKVTIPLVATSSISLENIVCRINITYQDTYGQADSTDTVINLPIKEEYLKIERVYVPKTVLINVRARVSIIFENSGDEAMYNTVMLTKGSGMEDFREEIGTVLGGSIKNQEVYISFYSLGDQSISVEFVYEDVEGNSYSTKTQNYDIEVLSLEEELMDEPILIEDSSLNKSVGLKQKIYMVGFFGCLAGIIVFVLRKRKK
jgi:hypothetical protein